MKLAEHMFCDKEKLVKQINQLVDFEEEKITEPINRYLFRIFVYLLNKFILSYIILYCTFLG